MIIVGNEPEKLLIMPFLLISDDEYLFPVLHNKIEN